MILVFRGDGIPSVSNLLFKIYGTKTLRYAHVELLPSEHKSERTLRHFQYNIL